MLIKYGKMLHDLMLHCLSYTYHGIHPSKSRVAKASDLDNFTTSLELLREEMTFTQTSPSPSTVQLSPDQPWGLMWPWLWVGNWTGVSELAMMSD